MRKSAWLWCVKAVLPSRSFSLSHFQSVYPCALYFAFAVEPFTQNTHSICHIAHGFMGCFVLFFLTLSRYRRSLLLLPLHFLNLYDSCWFFIFTFCCCYCCYLFVGPSLTNTTTHVDSLWLTIRFVQVYFYGYGYVNVCVCVWHFCSAWLYVYKYICYGLWLYLVPISNK